MRNMKNPAASPKGSIQMLGACSFVIHRTTRTEEPVVAVIPMVGFMMHIVPLPSVVV